MSNITYDYIYNNFYSYDIILVNFMAGREAM